MNHLLDTSGHDVTKRKYFNKLVTHNTATRDLLRSGVSMKGPPNNIEMRFFIM